MALAPHVVAVDAGSTDPGPYYLGAGISFTDRAAVKRDVKIILCATRKAGIPFIVGSAGGAGGRPIWSGSQISFAKLLTKKIFLSKWHLSTLKLIKM